MKKVCHSISAALILVLVFGSVVVTGAAARENGLVTENKLVSGDPVADAQFGRSVAMAGDLVAVGEGGDGAIGAVYLYKRQGMTYVPEATLETARNLGELLPFRVIRYSSEPVLHQSAV